jgi:hypothetical protein
MRVGASVGAWIFQRITHCPRPDLCLLSWKDGLIIFRCFNMPSIHCLSRGSESVLVRKSCKIKEWALYYIITFVEQIPKSIIVKSETIEAELFTRTTSICVWYRLKSFFWCSCPSLFHSIHWFVLTATITADEAVVLIHLLLSHSYKLIHNNLWNNVIC